MNEFGKFLTSKRLEMGYSARKFANILDTSASYLCDIEQGRKTPPFTDDKNIFYEKIIKYLCLTPEEITLMYKCVDVDLSEKGVVSPDIVNYINSDNNSRILFRTIKELNPTEQDLKDAIEFLKKKVKKDRLFIKDNEIDEKAQKLLEDNFPQFLLKPCPVDIELIIEKNGISLQAVVFKDRKILGASVFQKHNITVIDSETMLEKVIEVNENTILYDEFEASKSDTRFRMTLAHEFAHMILHKPLYIDNDNILCRTEDILIETSEYKTLVTKKDWEEHQANYFAACLLIPNRMIKNILFKASYDYEIPSVYNLKFISIEERELIANRLSEIFIVSKQMAMIRLRKILSELK